MMLALVATTGTTPASAAPEGDVAGTSAELRKADRYSPRAGVKLNDPLSKLAARRAVYNQIRKSIESARKRSVIQIATWNFSSARLRRELIQAHDRGVAVRLIMQRNMAKIQGPNGDFRQLNRALKRDGDRPRNAKRSWARLCGGSCRGPGGIVHSKVHMFSKLGDDRDIVMVGSGNTTDFSASVQWNDNYTIKNDAGTYDFFTKIFNQMKRDRPVRRTTQTFKVDRDRTAIIFPHKRKKVKYDPVLRRLRGVECRGATGDAGNSRNRTVIRVAQTAILDDRGEAIARRLRELHNDGCNVKILYAVAKSRVLDVLGARGGRGPMKHREITQDTDGDGVYDRYLHLKILTINGVYRGKTDAFVTWNGSENWTRVAINSDEAGYRIERKGVTMEYSRYIDRLYADPPRNARLSARVDLDSIDRYAKVEIH
jgi:phosphatidylserine/phosphatidylglycerophosphate/cardiolipin synthase-like enzyme